MIAAPSELSRAITSGDWSMASKLAKRFPEQARKKSNREGLFDGRTNARVYPIHEALVANAPLSCVKALVEAYPDSLLKAESSYHRLPLHCACRKNADPAVISYLVRKNKQACLEEDSLRRLPVHYALTNGANPHVVSILVKADPGSVRGCDYSGWTPVHVAINVCASPTTVATMLKAFPESVLLKTNKHSSMRSVIPKSSPYRKEHKQLIDETQNVVQMDIHLPSLRYNSMRASRLIMV